MKEKVKIVLGKGAKIPTYATKNSAGFDLRAHLDFPMTIAPGERVMIPTGTKIQLPEGYEGQIRPRSGLAIKNGITVLNAPGTIDSDYRGEIKVLLINLSKDAYTLVPGERIAQMVVSKVEQVENWEQCETLDESERGEGGFGHTGKI